MTILMNVNQTPEELNSIYREDYYWYLKSPQFRETFLKPLGETVKKYGRSCLDVGCGEGWLADYVSGRYVGVDGSEVAILKAVKSIYPTTSQKKFCISRIEEPHIDWFPQGWHFPDVIVFGGIFSVLVARESHLDLLKLYQDTFQDMPEVFIIYDLQDLDTSHIEAKYTLIDQYFASVDMPHLQPDCKRHRKILTFRF